MCRVTLRSYPFAVLPQQGTEQTILCVDTDSGLVVDGEATGKDFVDPDGNLSPALQKVLDFLNELQRNRRATDVAVAALAGAGVIQLWPIKLKTEQGAQPAPAGLYRVDEVALNALTDEAFLKLHKASGGLPIAFAHRVRHLREKAVDVLGFGLGLWACINPIGDCCGLAQGRIGSCDCEIILLDR